MDVGASDNRQQAPLDCCREHMLALGAHSRAEPAESPYGDGVCGDAVCGDDVPHARPFLGDHHAANHVVLAAIQFEEHAALHLAEAAAVADEARSHRIDGASTLSGWASHHARAGRAEVRRHVRRGRAIAAFPLLRAAWSAHLISSAHVDGFARLIDDTDPVRFALLQRDEELLVGAATNLTADEFGRVARHWEALADPDGHEETWSENHDRRHMSIARDLMGNLLFRGQLDGAEGDAVSKAIGKVERELFNADWAAAEARLGREPSVSELDRTDAQRRADAFVLLLCGRSEGDPLQPPVSIDYVIDHESYERALDRIERNAADVCHRDDIGWIPSMPADSLAECFAMDHLPDTSGAFDPLHRSETLTGIPLPPEVIVADSLRARIRRVVFQGPSVIIDAGRSRRLFDGPQRHLVALVHRRCTSPYCDRPHWQCEIDHVLPWDAGGGTDLANAQPLCGHDHRRKTRQEQHLRIRANGTLALV